MSLSDEEKFADQTCLQCFSRLEPVYRYCPKCNSDNYLSCVNPDYCCKDDVRLGVSESWKCRQCKIDDGEEEDIITETFLITYDQNIDIFDCLLPLVPENPTTPEKNAIDFRLLCTTPSPHSTRVKSGPSENMPKRRHRSKSRKGKKKNVNTQKTAGENQEQPENPVVGTSSDDKIPEKEESTHNQSVDVEEVDPGVVSKSQSGKVESSKDAKIDKMADKEERKVENIAEKPMVDSKQEEKEKDSLVNAIKNVAKVVSGTDREEKQEKEGAVVNEAAKEVSTGAVPKQKFKEQESSQKCVASLTTGQVTSVKKEEELSPLDKLIGIVKKPFVSLIQKEEKRAESPLNLTDIQAGIISIHTNFNQGGALEEASAVGYSKDEAVKKKSTQAEEERPGSKRKEKMSPLNIDWPEDDESDYSW